MTGTIFDIKKYAIHDGPGIRTTVFLKGCPMDCWWCHNPEGGDGDAGGLSEKARTVSVSEVIQEIDKDRIFYDQSGGGVTFSGGEPLAQPEFLKALLEACHYRGLHTTVDTCGYAPTEDFERICELTGLFLYDIKLMDNDQHKKYTGVPNDLVLKNLRWLVNRGAQVQLRIPLIPDITDTEDNLSAIYSFLEDLPDLRGISLLPYNQFGADKRARFGLGDRLGKLPSLTKADVETVVNRFTPLGYEVKVGG
ncbi:MAG: glycyl-radical enzyme activating protein [Candidatus Zixiibacteriota bacterium]|nr:MAG: glycyl-radical enzyme activating protein [candidate division Zixibacteria bacterium]